MAANDAMYVRLTAVGNVTAGGTGAGCVLRAVNVNTGTATSVLTLRDGSSTGAVIAIIDCATKSSQFYGDIRFQNGIYAAMTTANSDVTITVA